MHDFLFWKLEGRKQWKRDRERERESCCYFKNAFI